MWPLSNITSTANSRTAGTNSNSQVNTSPHQKEKSRLLSNPIFCQVVGCMSTIDRFDKYRPNSPSIVMSKRNIQNVQHDSVAVMHPNDQNMDTAYSHHRSGIHQPNHPNHGIDKSHENGNNLFQAYTLKKMKPSSNKKRSKDGKVIQHSHQPVQTDTTNVKDQTTTTTTTSNNAKKPKNKRVTFNVIEVREHPRILGDNPSAKKGPPLSIGWYRPSTGRVLIYSVDEYERRRESERNKSVLILSPIERQRMLLREAGVTPSEIFAARQEVSKIRKSRRDHNILVDYDETIVAFEQCIQTVQRLFSAGKVTTDGELTTLMEQAQRFKQNVSKQ